VCVNLVMLLSSHNGHKIRDRNCSKVSRRQPNILLFMENGPTVVVAAIQFLIEGGKELLGYEYIPVTLKELTKVLHKKFSAKEKCVFINNGLYSAVSTG